ncbi:ABC transporter substrate-binding protein [Rhizobium sp. CRIBSB]|nr:ABC transporter substrate-binding protein [Rhizobium sp. CRIBSB]
MQKHRFSAIAALAGAFVLSVGAAPSMGEPLKITHAQGVTEVVAATKTVLTFDLSALDTLTALGVDVAGVPEANLPKSLSQFATKPKIGSLFEPDYEAVSALEPDLVIVAGRAAPKYAELAAIAPTVDLTTNPKTFMTSATGNIRKLGEIFGKQAEAEAALSQLEASTSALRAQAQSAGKAMLVLTTGGKMSTYGRGSRFGVLFTDYGFQPVDDQIAAGNHGQPISFEYILEKNPDWLFVLDRDGAIGEEGASASRLLDNEIVRQTVAWQKGQVVYLDAASWYLVGAGLTSLQSSVDQITAALAKK